MNEISKKGISLLLFVLFILVLLTCEKDRFKGNFEPKFVEKYQSTVRQAKKDFEAQKLKKAKELEDGIKEREALLAQLKVQTEKIMIKGYEDAPQADAVIVTAYRDPAGKYFFDLRGDLWFLNTERPRFYLASTGEEISMSDLTLYRSSYNTIAPFFDQYGNSLVFGTFPKYWGRGYDLDLYYSARDVDDAILYYQKGIWTFEQARQHMLGSTFLINLCNINKGIARSYGLLKSNAINSLEDLGFNILDLINVIRWGCPVGSRTGVCYGMN